MTSWWRGPMCAFDTETTGADPATARIVTAAHVVLGGTEKATVSTWLVDPGVDIPPEATAIHGITTDRARAEGGPAPEALDDIAATVAWQLCHGLPLVGHNVRYDLTVLHYELARHGLLSLAGRLGGDVRPVVDTLVLDKHVDPYRKGKRTLGRCAEVYTIKQEDAHAAYGDALTAARVAWRIGARYPDIGSKPIDELHDAQVRWAHEQALSLQKYFRRKDPTAVVETAWPVALATEVAR